MSPRVFEAIEAIRLLGGPQNRSESAVHYLMRAISDARADERRAASRRLRLGAEEAKRNGDTQVAETLFNYAASVAAGDHLDSAEDT